ncbi:LCP family protein [bacterium]|nr:LCP family protein [bacterium]
MLKRWYFWLLMSVVFVISLGATLLAWPRDQLVGETVVITDVPGQNDQPEVEAPPDPLRVRYIALLGHGGAGHDGGSLADTVMVAQIVPHAATINLLSLPRDLWVELPVTKSADSSQNMHAKLNTTLSVGSSERMYTWRDERFQGKNGGGQLAKEVIGQIIGQAVEYYVAVDFSGFVRLIEIIGGSSGLKINVPYSFVDEFYPIEGEQNNNCDFSEEQIAQLTEQYTGYELEQQFTCRYERLEFNQGLQLIEPEQLLKFVRSRHSGVGGGDFGRSARQQVVMEAVKDKIFSLSFVPKWPEFIATVFKIVRTDLDLDLMSDILRDWGDIREYTIKSYVVDNKELLRDGRSSDGQYVLMPRSGEGDYSQIHALVQTMIDEATREASLAGRLK